MIIYSQIETRLRRKATRTGEAMDALVETLLFEVLIEEASEDELRDELCASVH